MKYADVSGMSAQDLRKKKSAIRAEMFEARMKNALGQLQSPASIKNMRRDIAKIFTALKNKNI